MKNEKSINWFYSNCVKPLIEAVVKKGDDLDFGKLRRTLSRADDYLANNNNENIDSMAVKFIRTLYPQDLSSKDSLVSYFRKIIEMDQYLLFHVYSLAHDLKIDEEFDPVIQDEIDEILECYDKSYEAIVYKFGALLNICNSSDLNLNKSKVSVENLETLAQPILSDIYKKSKLIGYRSDEILEIANDLGINISKTERKDIEPKSEYKLWKELYDKLSDIVRDSTNVTSDGLLIYSISKMLNQVRNLVSEVDYKDITKELREKLSKSTDSGDLMDYVFNYVSEKLKDYEGS